MAEIIHEFQLQIIAALVTLAVALIKYLTRPRSQLIYSRPHSFTFLLQPEKDKPPFIINTTSLWVSNAGREAATEVEITFNYRPQNYNVWPARPFETHDAEDNRHTLKFSNIAPREFLQIEMISNLELPQIVSFRSKEGVAKLIKMAPLRLYSKPIIVTYLVLAGIGCATCLYVALRLVVPYVPWLQ
jgi:hypothetical protein